MNRGELPDPKPDLGLWDAQFEVFKTMTPPLRPHRSEIAIMQALADRLGQGARQRRFEALLLGLTPEYLGLHWPGGGRVTVVDRSRHVVGEWWPGDVPGRRELVVADWLDMPFGPGGFDLILGDGVFNFMPYPRGYREFATRLARLLRPGGRLAVRVFVQAEPPERPADLLAEYHQSERIDYFGFRFRLAQSIQESPEQGLYLNKHAIDAYLLDQGVALEELYRKSGHTPPRVALPPADARDSFRVSYPTAAQFAEQIAGAFAVDARPSGDHPLARRTPIFIATPKQ